MNHRANALIVVISILLFALIVGTGCQRAAVDPAAAVDETEGATEPATTSQAKGEATSSEEQGAVARAGDGEAVAKSDKAEASAGSGKARAGDAVAGGGEPGKGSRGEDRGLSGKAKLKIGGQPGTQFSGTCAVGGEEQDVSGRVPGRFVYDLDGRELECEIRKADAADGAIEISVDADGLRREARVRGQGDEISFSLTEQGTNFSTFSSSSGDSVSQETKITSSSNSSVSSNSR